MQELANFSMVSSSITQDVETPKNRRVYNAQYRAYRRKVDERFAESERAANRKHRAFQREFNKALQLFAEAYPSEFQTYIEELKRAQ
jgi:hypothetical protein